MQSLIEENRQLRHLLFMSHGSEEHYLYGDDGERQCNACGIDFNKDTPKVMQEKMHEFNILKIVEMQKLHEIHEMHTYREDFFNGNYCTECLKAK